jgi:hypothetical protein
VRFRSIVLACGALVLLLAVVIGQRMGDRVMQQATEQQLESASLKITPAPSGSAQPFGPDWKRSQSISAAGDPHFPDPRVPPVPIPTLAPTPKPTATPTPGPTLNPNVPVWRQKPLPTINPSASPDDGAAGTGTPEAANSPEASPSP